MFRNDDNGDREDDDVNDGSDSRLSPADAAAADRSLQ
jgi:hypothetical protein